MAARHRANKAVAGGFAVGMPSFYGVLAVRTRCCCWCIAVYFKFLAWKALHCTVSCRTLGFSPVQPPMSMIWTRTLLVLFSTGEPSPVASVEHAQLFEVQYSRQSKWHTEPVAQ